MTAAVAATLTQILRKKGWLRLLLEKGNNLNKKMDPTITGIKFYNTVTCKERNVFLGTTTTWINEVFYNLLFRQDFFVHLLIIFQICYFRCYQLIGWENFFLSHCNWTWTHNHLVHKRKLNHCLKSKEEKKFYLSLFKIAADILK